MACEMDRTCARVGGRETSGTSLHIFHVEKGCAYGESFAFFSALPPSLQACHLGRSIIVHTTMGGRVSMGGDVCLFGERQRAIRKRLTSPDSAGPRSLAVSTLSGWLTFSIPSKAARKFVIHFAPQTLCVCCHLAPHYACWELAPNSQLIVSHGVQSPL